MATYMAFDIGGSGVKYARLNENADFAAHGTIAPVPVAFDDLVDAMAGICEELCPAGMDGIAISSPGTVDPKSGFAGGISMVPAIHQGSVKQALEARFGVPVSVENDANCVALGEKWKGAAQDVTDALFVVIGSGIGGAVLRDGGLDRGTRFQAGEFGYMLMPDAGGIRTWSEMASVRALAEQVCREKGVAAGSLDGKAVFAQAEQGDPICCGAVNRFYEGLALGIYNLYYAFDPQAIFLGGAVSACPTLAEEIKRCWTRLFEHNGLVAPDLRIEACCFRGNANLIGALYALLRLCEGKG